MFQRVYEGRAFAILDRIGTFILANILFVLLAIPLVTLPLGLAGLFATMSPWARGKQAEVFHDFFGAIRKHWLKAMIVGVIDAAIVGLVYLNISIFRVMDAGVITLLSQSMTLFVALMALMVNLHLWAMMIVLPDLSVRHLLGNSLKLVFIHPVWSFVMLVLTAIPLVVSLWMPAAFLVMAAFSTTALVANWGAWRVLRHHMPDEEAAANENIVETEV